MPAFPGLKVHGGDRNTLLGLDLRQHLAPRGDNRGLTDSAEIAIRVTGTPQVGAEEEDAVFQRPRHAHRPVSHGAVVPLLADVGGHPGRRVTDQLRARVHKLTDILGEDVVVADS